jgi:hypothetical protein
MMMTETLNVGLRIKLPKKKRKRNGHSCMENEIDFYGDQ